MKTAHIAVSRREIVIYAIEVPDDFDITDLDAGYEIFGHSCVDDWPEIASEYTGEEPASLRWP